MLCLLRVQRPAACSSARAAASQFSVTSGTTFHGRKLSIRDYLMAIAIFANAAKGTSALQLGRDLDVSYKTAFVLAHKLREAMGADQAKYSPRATWRSTAPTSAATAARRSGWDWPDNQDDGQGWCRNAGRA